MDDTILLVWVLIAVGFVTCGFIIALFQRLRVKHPAVYNAMGQPKIYQKSSIFPVLKFLFRREYKPLSDSRVTLISYAIAANLLVYVLIFVKLMIDP